MKFDVNITNRQIKRERRAARVLFWVWIVGLIVTVIAKIFKIMYEKKA